MRVFKKVCAFLLVNILTAALLHFVLTPPAKVGIYLKEMQRDTYSSAVVGQSHTTMGIDPYQLDNENGKCFNLSYMQIPVRNLYYSIKEANSIHHLDRVYFELSSFYFCNANVGKTTGKNINMFSYLTGKTQLDYFWNCMFQQDYAQALFDYRFSMKAVKEIPETLREKCTANYLSARDWSPTTTDRIAKGDEISAYCGRGFSYAFAKKEAPYSIVQFSEEDIDAESLEYFYKTVQYCKDNNIELIYFISALPPYRLKNENHDAVHKYFSKLCAEENVRFLDGNYIKQEFMPRSDDDFMDMDGHMMGYLAENQTRMFLEILNSEHPDRYFYETYEEVLEASK